MNNEIVTARKPRRHRFTVVSAQMPPDLLAAMLRHPSAPLGRAAVVRAIVTEWADK